MEDKTPDDIKKLIQNLHNFEAELLKPRRKGKRLAGDVIEDLHTAVERAVIVLERLGLSGSHLDNPDCMCEPCLLQQALMGDLQAAKKIAEDYMFDPARKKKETE